MPIEFKIPQRLIGLVAETSEGPGLVGVVTSESLTSHDGSTLAWRLEEFQNALFRFIPGLPPPSLIDHILVVIRQDLTAVAYVNELQQRAMVKVRRAISASEQVLVDDVEDVSKVELGVTIPDDAGFVIVRSFGWRKALFFDFGPLNVASPRRSFDVGEALARSALTLYKKRFSEPRSPVGRSEEERRAIASRSGPNAVFAGAGLAALTKLLSDRCDDEAQYQQFLESHPWILGGSYLELQGHRKLDDKNIPDFTAVRRHDDCHDIIEIKQPFLPCFRAAGGFSSAFNDAWNQVERYLVFAREHRDYLSREKELQFENPRCLLVAGYRFTPEEQREIRRKEACNLAITVISYDRLLAIAAGIIELLRQPFANLDGHGAPTTPKPHSKSGATHKSRKRRKR